MAIFIERARLGGTQSFNYPSVAYFPVDCPSGSSYYEFIQRLGYDQITAGCGSGSFCPNSPITRADLAIFIARSLLNIAPATVGVTPSPTNPSSPNPYLARTVPLTVVGGTNSTATQTALTVYGVLPSSITSPALRVMGCAFQSPSLPCTGTPGGTLTVTEGATSTASSGAPFANTQITTTISASFSESSPSSISGPVPQSILLSINPNSFPGGSDPKGNLNSTYVVTGGNAAPPTNMVEVLIPNVLRIVDNNYANVASPVSNNIPFTSWNSGWTQTMTQGSSAIQRTNNYNSGSAVQQIEHAPSSYPYFQTANDPTTFPANLSIDMAGNAGEGTHVNLPDLNSTICPSGWQAWNYNMTHPALGGPPGSGSALTYAYIYQNIWDWITPLLPGNPTIVQYTGEPSSFTPAAGAKGIMFLGNFSGESSTAPTQASESVVEAFYILDQGCSGADDEYGVSSFFWNPGRVNNGIVQFYFSTYSNCYANDCLDFNGNPQPNGISYFQNITFSNPPNGTPADLTTNYYYGAYMVADSSPQGYRMRYQVVTQNPGNPLAQCYIYPSTTLQPCVFDVDTAEIDMASSLHFLDASPSYFTALYNGQSYLHIDFEVNPGYTSPNYLWPTLTDASPPQQARFTVNGAYLSQ